MRKIKVYATCFWQDDISLYNYLKRYGLSGKAEWKNIEFTPYDNFDIAVILTAPYKTHKPFNPTLAITFLTEPPGSLHHIVNNTSRISPMYCPELFWGLGRNDIKRIINGNFTKTKCLSSVTSEQSSLEGHKERLAFIYYLDNKIKEGFDLFGRKYSGNYFKLINAYRGEIKNKLDALIPYQYHFACENSYMKGYFTEKILQPILSESLCFYDGCTNMSEFIDDRAFVKIEIKNIESSIEKVIKSICNNEYIKRQPFIKKEKNRVLKDFNLLNIIWAEVNEKDTLKYFKL